jgi:hypothetical protein
MILTTPKETDVYEAFDLAANAWEELDLYQRSSDAAEERDQQSADEAALENAGRFVDQALKKDPEYFKARYLEAITTYFTDPDAATVQFELLLGEERPPNNSPHQLYPRYWIEAKKPARSQEHLNALNQEIRFNKAAARLETIADPETDHGEVDEIKKEFETLKQETKKDSPLNLLARSAHALCNALTGTSKELRRIWWRLWLIELFPWRIETWSWRIRVRKIEIDNDTAAAIRKILRYAKNPHLWKELSRPVKAP